MYILAQCIVNSTYVLYIYELLIVLGIFLDELQTESSTFLSN